LSPSSPEGGEGGTTLCRRLASDLLQLDDDAAAQGAVAYARRTLLDALGSALAGTSSPEVTAVLSAASAWGGGGSTAVWGTDVLLPAPQAALVNGTATHALEVDDFGGCGHSGAVVIPAALAAAQHRPTSGATLLAAIVAGYEAASRVIDLCGGYPAHNAAGWHSTGTCGTFGAAAAAARVLGLSAGGTAQALALAGTYAGGIWCFLRDGAMSKRLHAGKAAEGGVSAAFLAAAGMTGPTHLFEPGWGTFATLYGGEAVQSDALPRRQGDPLLIFRTGFKPYACCRGNHSAVDVVLELRRQGVTADDIDSIRVRGSDQHVRQLGKQQVANMLDAQMSLPYSVAVALIHGRADVKYFQQPYLRDPAIAALAGRTAIVAEAAGAALAEPTVEVHLAGGRILEGRVDVAKGAPSNPLSDEEMSEKFMSLAVLGMPAARAAEIADFVAGIESVPSVAPLIRMLGAGRAVT
jgi:2-methylcitrate dehydratase PrpD